MSRAPYRSPERWRADITAALAENLCGSELAQKLGVANATITKAQKRTGIWLPKKWKGRGSGIDRDWRAILTDAVARDLSLGDVAAEQCVTKPAVHHQTRKLGIFLKGQEAEAA